MSPSFQDGSLLTGVTQVGGEEGYAGGGASALLSNDKTWWPSYLHFGFLQVGPNKSL